MSLASRALLAAALVSASLVTSIAGVANAHDQWLEAEPFFAARPGREKIYLYLGDRFASPQPIIVKNRDKYARFFIQSNAGRRNILADMREDSTPIAMLTSGAATGSFVIALDTQSHTLELDPKHFGEYLLEERLIDVLQQRMNAGTEETPGRERYSRNLKALVQIGANAEAFVTQPLGQDIEIVPETNPYALPANGRLIVKVLFKGKPLVGRAITAVNRYRGDIAQKTTRLDANGRVAFELNRPGDWMLRVVHMEPSTQPDVEWRSYWANLTFALGEPAAAPAPAAPKPPKR